ncbi:MAG: hypothetical protein NTX03_06780 [Bacteroidetes bacterium]|nr:hypothetical protein [Bacteroidota bacterium]
MNKILCVLLLVAMAACNNSNKNNEGGKSSGKDGDMLSFYKKLFAQASRNEDPYTMLQSANAIVVLDEAGSVNYLDSLANLYTALNMIPQAGKMAEKGLKKNPKNTNLLEIKINADASTGNFDGALTQAQKLYSETNDIKYLYFQAQINMQAQNMKAAGDVINSLEAHPNFTKDSVKLQAQNGMQKVPIPAVTLYMRGIIDLQSRKGEEGVKKMQKALEIFPAFYMCRRDLQQIMQRAQEQQQQQRQPQR